MGEIPAEEFTALYEHFSLHPIPVNKYRNVSGTGRSQTLGIVGRRCLPPDYSRMNWHRPFTLKLLKEFADKWVPIPWNAVTINQSYKAAPHRDKNNVGPSFLVAFGNYQGGALKIHEGDRKGVWDIKHRPIIHDFSKDLHSVQDFVGHRFSLVFYWYDLKGVELPGWDVKMINDQWRFFRGDQMITKKTGLPHPLRHPKPVSSYDVTP